jgi:predicted cupin superfamily sugar epimerase/uncharacterized protein (DUF952 family)
VIIHLISLADVRAQDGPITAESLRTQGFVHCSPDEPTMLAVANRFYANATEQQIALILDPDKITADVRWEAPDPPDGSTALFPHVYGPIDREAIVEIRYARRDVTNAYVSLDSRPPTAEALDLLPHPEGGWYGETWRTAHTYVPDGYPGERSTATGIYYLLRPGEFSAWHKVRSDELWLWHGGLPLKLTLSADKPEARDVRVLGGDLAAGQRPQQLVPAGYWQTAEPIGSDGEVLVSCVVSPGFDFADFSVPTVN